MWYQLYDLEDKGKRTENKAVQDIARPIRDDHNVTMRYAVKITWENMEPPWPTDDEVRRCALLLSVFTE